MNELGAQKDSDGRYLLRIETFGTNKKYTVLSRGSVASANKMKINGVPVEMYDGLFEMKCDKYEISEETINLVINND